MMTRAYRNVESRKARSIGRACDPACLPVARVRDATEFTKGSRNDETGSPRVRRVPEFLVRQIEEQSYLRKARCSLIDLVVRLRHKFQKPSNGAAFEGVEDRLF